MGSRSGRAKKERTVGGCVFLVDADESARYMCIVICLQPIAMQKICDINELRLSMNSIRLAMRDGRFGVCVLALAFDHSTVNWMMIVGE